AVSGRVLDPDGKPVPGAEITLWWHFGYTGFYRWWHPETLKPFKPRFGAISEADGRFRFTFAKSGVEENPLNIWDKPWRTALVVAAARGYGPAWASLERIEKGGLTLRLARDDVPIKGHVVDLQGRPVAGARIGVERVATAGQDEHHSLWQPVWLGLPKEVGTDKDGRFSLSSVGRDRTVVLHINGPTIEHKIVSVSTQAVVEGKKVEKVPVEVVAGPTKPIVGTVRARDTGKPLPGVVVYGQEEGFHRSVRAVTDAQGRYRLVGLPKMGQYEPG